MTGVRATSLDVVLAGVGGQGVLSVAAVVALAAQASGLRVKQGEVHGMSQRGGAVQAHLRMSADPIQSDLIPRGQAGLILSLEPVEGLRYLEYLAPEGTLLTAGDPFENIPDYPDLERVLEAIRSLPHSQVIPARSLAREAGSLNAANVVMVGAATPLLPLDPCGVEDAVARFFRRKGEKVVRTNLTAFRLGRERALSSGSSL